NCAQLYYQALRYCFSEEWNFTGRNCRTPCDPINALLIWGYSILLSRSFVACVQAGLYQVGMNDHDINMGESPLTLLYSLYA
ncbi:MAG TPA: CRISPR-associated endonuclease Cas1, partial [Candidatus Obscuribacterales bacterium]